jgi:hypothetical protein
MSASVWQCYTGWLWRSVGKTAMSIPALNNVFGADTSLLSFLSVEMLQKYKTGYFMALFAWYDIPLYGIWGNSALYLMPGCVQESDPPSILHARYALCVSKHQSTGDRASCPILDDCK